MILNFFISAEDQARIDPDSIVIEDIIGSVAPSLPQLIRDNATLQSLLIRFKITDPENGPPEIKPFFSGHVNYAPDADDEGVIPNPADVDAGLTKFDEWNIHGTIRIQADKESVDHLEQLNLALSAFDREAPVLPNQIWYYPICLTRAFLLDLLLATRDIVLTRSGETVILTPGHPTSASMRLVDFFRSHFAQWIQVGVDVPDLAARSMPTVKMAANGDVTLAVAMALSQVPQDNRDVFDGYTPEVGRLHPRHAANGAIPPRYILHKFKNNLEFGAPGNVLADAVLAAPVDYVPIQFTRTAKRMLNCSIFFPTQQIHISDAAGSLLWEQRLPAHGVVFLPKTPGESISTIQIIETSAVPDISMYHVKGVEGNWKHNREPDPLNFDLTSETRPHVVLRLPMATEVLPEVLYQRESLDTALSEGRLLSACSYMSLRRTVHALLNNRIAGGRYNFVGKTAEFRNELLAEVLPAALLDKVRSNLPETKFTGTEPQQVEQIRKRAKALREVLEILFPDPAPEYPAGTPSPGGTYPLGRVAYTLWQSDLEKFSQSSTRRFYGDDFIGRGAPGALRALGLAEYVWDPEPAAGQNDTNPAFLQQIVTSIIDNAEPGMLIQFWRLSSDFRRIKQRQTNQSYGHSPVFLAQPTEDNPFNGFWVLDHNGAAHVVREPASQLLNWMTLSSHVEQIWIVARWLE